VDLGTHAGGDALRLLLLVEALLRGARAERHSSPQRRWGDATLPVAAATAAAQVGRSL